MFLLNQTCNFGTSEPDGTISILINDESTIDTNLRESLNIHGFTIISWMEQEARRKYQLSLLANYIKENMMVTEKENKLKLLLRILGLNIGIDPFHEVVYGILIVEDYCLTFDNVLKMIAIFFRVRSNIPVIIIF
jgi:hypothetical protein